MMDKFQLFYTAILGAKDFFGKNRKKLAQEMLANLKY